MHTPFSKLPYIQSYRIRMFGGGGLRPNIVLYNLVGVHCLFWGIFRPHNINIKSLCYIYRFPKFHLGQQGRMLHQF